MTFKEFWKEFKEHNYLSKRDKKLSEKVWNSAIREATNVCKDLEDATEIEELLSV